MKSIKIFDDSNSGQLTELQSKKFTEYCIRHRHLFKSARISMSLDDYENIMAHIAMLAWESQLPD